MKTIDDAGGMYKAVESGLVQRMIGASALRFQHKVESGEQTIVGVNAYRADDDARDPAGGRAPRSGRDAGPSRRLRRLEGEPLAGGGERRARRADPRRRGPDRQNVFAAVVDGARAGLSNEEICDRLRRDLGFGQPLAFV